MASAALFVGSSLSVPLWAQDGPGELRRFRDGPPPEPPRGGFRGPAPVMVKVPYAGFRIEEAPEALSHHLPIPRGFGLLVTEVVKDSPAEKVGIQRYDVLLRSGEQMLANPAQMRALIRAKKPGETMSFLVFRAGKEWEVNLVLWEVEEPEGRAGERFGAFWERSGQFVRQLGEKVRRLDGPEVDLSKSAAFSKELLEKAERLGDDAMRKFRELEPFQFPLPGAKPGAQSPPEGTKEGQASEAPRENK